MWSRRGFLRASTVLGSTALSIHAKTASLTAASAAVAQQPPDEVAVIEPFWREVRASFTLDPKFINLDNASGAPRPRTVHESLKRHLDEINMLPAHYGSLIAERGEAVRRDLATDFGCDPSELTVTGTPDDALHVGGFIGLQAGDEVVTIDHERPSRLSAWDERARRGGVVVTRVPFPVPALPADLLTRFEAAITPRTRVLQLSHVTQTTGQLLPVRDLGRLARSRGILTIVDGTQALGHFPFRLRDLECDVYVASLDTWLMAPEGTGLVFMRPETDIKTFAQPRPNFTAAHAAISEAITFHRAVGSERKAARLRYLTMRWINGVRSRPQVRILSSLQPNETWGLAAFAINRMDAAAVVPALREKQGIVVGAHGEGIRVSPGIYTSIEEIDRFVAAVRELL
jgi:selenocysteine lyase/cysteine desulfurase